MANPTTNYSWTLPVENTGTNWDATLNALFQSIDTQVFANEGVADAALPVAGGTMTGNVKVFTVTDTVTNLGATLSGSVAMDLSTANDFYGTATGAVTFTISNSPASGTGMWWTLELTNGGASGVTWPAAVKWDGGTTPTLQSAGVDIFVFYTRDNGTTVRGIQAYSAAS